MMSDREDQPIDIIEEADDQDGRKYECMYCKQGFTTAQALGGHMNVHRKDRAKSKWSNSTNNKCTGLATSCSPNHHHHREGQTRKFMQSRSSPKICDSSRYNHKHQNVKELTVSQAREEIRMSLSLSLQFGQSYEEESIQRGNEGDELDLELRLGYI